MIILGNFLISIAGVLGIIFNTLLILVTIRIILSWVNPDPYNPIVRFIVSTTDPLFQLLRPIGKYINPKGSGIDFVPLLLLLVIYFLKFFLVQIIHDYGNQIRNAGLLG